MSDTNTSHDVRKGKESAATCQFAPLLWIIVLLLLLCFAALTTAAGALSLTGAAQTAVGSVTAAALYCTMVVAMLLVAGIVLGVVRRCLAACSIDAKAPDDYHHTHSGG